MDLGELEDLVGVLRAEGGDLPTVEVKRAAGGFPQSLAPTLSASGNTPGGGRIVFGLDEAAGFAPIGVYDAVRCQQALANACRQAVDRAYDGDFALSGVEEQAFIANRATPRFDQEEVPQATAADLDPTLVDDYVDACRRSVAMTAMPPAEVLYRTGVLVGPERRPSVAGLLALGIYPQQFFPSLVIQASLAPGPEDPPGTRVADSARFDGPLPTMLDQALRWVQRSTRRRIVFGAGGHGHDRSEYPLEAVRELLSNALVHRDLGPHARHEPIALRLDARQLVLSNPGGLYGLSVDRLGRTGVTSSRNGWLVRVCQNVRFGGDRRVCEALASGIPAVLQALESVGMVKPRFLDQGVRFTVLLPNHALLAPDDLEWLAALPGSGRLSDTQRHALVAMRHGRRWTNRSFRDEFPMDSTDARRELAGLVDLGLAQAEGERGSRVYVAARGDEPVPLPRWSTAGASNAEAIAAALAGGPMTASELSAALRLTSRQTTYALGLLRDRGRVELQGGRGKGTFYVLT